MNFLAWSLVKIPAAKYAEMQSHVRGHFPEEACGLLAGTITGNEILVHSVLPVENQLHSPVRFRMEPYEQLKALNWIDEQGYTLVGIFHSHPNGPHCPSQTDLAEAFYPEAAYLIWYRDETNWACRAYRLSGGAVVEIHLHLIAEEQL